MKKQPKTMTVRIRPETHALLAWLKKKTQLSFKELIHIAIAQSDLEIIENNAKYFKENKK